MLLCFTPSFKDCLFCLRSSAIFYFILGFGGLLLLLFVDPAWNSQSFVTISQNSFQTILENYKLIYFKLLVNNGFCHILFFPSSFNSIYNHVTPFCYVLCTSYILVFFSYLLVFPSFSPSVVFGPIFQIVNSLLNCIYSTVKPSFVFLVVFVILFTFRIFIRLL